MRYADDFQVFVKSEVAGERVMASLEGFLEKRLRLKVIRRNSAVGWPWKRKSLGCRTTTDHKPRLKPDPKSVKRIMLKLKELFRRGRGWSLARTIRKLNPVPRGWGTTTGWRTWKGCSRTWTSGYGGDCPCSYGASGSDPGPGPGSFKRPRCSKRPLLQGPWSSGP